MNDNPDGEKTCVNIEGKDLLIHQTLYFFGDTVQVGTKLKEFLKSDNFRRRIGEPTHMVKSGHKIACWKPESLNFDLMEISGLAETSTHHYAYQKSGVQSTSDAKMFWQDLEFL